VLEAKKRLLVSIFVMLPHLLYLILGILFLSIICFRFENAKRNSSGKTPFFRPLSIFADLLIDFLLLHRFLAKSRETDCAWRVALFLPDHR
jgi:FtsH-binding integral membrane protein